MDGEITGDLQGHDSRGRDQAAQTSVVIDASASTRFESAWNGVSTIQALGSTLDIDSQS